VDNAIKYSPRNTTLSLCVERVDPHSVSISVKDAGPGITAEHAAHIFDRFYRVDTGRSRDAGGFGLGLAIAQWAVQAHKGAISVSSVPGQGSTFRITLPVDNTVDYISAAITTTAASNQIESDGMSSKSK
jgi:signal transduction histidine kinase